MSTPTTIAERPALDPFTLHAIATELHDQVERELRECKCIPHYARAILMRKLADDLHSRALKISIPINSEVGE